MATAASSSSSSYPPPHWQGTSPAGGQQRRQRTAYRRLGGELAKKTKKTRAGKRTDDTAARPHRCTTCGRTYATERSLHRHRGTHAAAAAATDHRRCGACGTTFAEAHRSAGGRPYGWCAQCCGWRPGRAAERRDAGHACAVCAKTYRSRRTLKRHALSVHGEGRRRFECDACDKTFASNYTLQRHLVLARCAGKPCERCTNASCKDDRKSAILRRVFTYVLSRAVATR